jgi:hypothetical protein
MKKTFLNKLLLGFSAVLLFVYGIIYACGGGNWDWSWSFDSNFAPETFVDASYAPLFLSQEVFYTGFDTEHNSRFNDEIVQDWETFLKGKMDTKSIKFFLIDSSATDIDNLELFYKTKKKNTVSNEWSKTINLNDRKIRSFITFLSLSKQIEKASLDNNNNWGYNYNQRRNFEDINTVKAIENKYNTVSDAFLKNRYWFQTIKAYFYSGDNKNTLDFFEKTKNKVPKNTLYYRALAYIAGIEYEQKQYAKSNFLYSQVFDKCPAMRIVATYCFHPQEQKDWEESLILAKTKEEKAALWAIQGYYGDEERAIAEIYKLLPKSPHLDFLLTRLINNQEIKIDKSFKEKSVVENKKSVKDSISKSAIDLVVTIAQSDKTAKPYLWNVAAGYLETLNGNYSQADTNFDNAESKMPQTPLAINQIRLLRFVNNLSKMERIDSNNEKTILKDLAWLYVETPKNNIENFRYQNAIAWSQNYLSALYKSQKNEVMAELFARDNSFYENEKNLQEMKRFLAKNNKTEIENIGVNVYNVTLEDINNYQAVMATFANKIPEAIDFMQQTNKIQEIKFYGNPFNGGIKDCHDCDHLAYQKKKYSQIDFLNTIKAMQENVAKGDDVYTNLILLGNAFYNITHFGNARLFYQINIGPYNFSEYNCSLAKRYYQKALTAAKNNEQKAKCVYMIAKCERNEYYNNQYHLSKNSWENQFVIESSTIDFIAWEGFKTLKNKYAQTQYYKEVIKECGYFKTYVSQK